MNLKVVLDRGGKTSARCGMLNAYVDQGGPLGANILAKNQFTDVENAQRFVEHALRAKLRGMDLAIEWELRFGVEGPAEKPAAPAPGPLVADSLRADPPAPRASVAPPRPERPIHRPRLTIQQRFEAYNKAHPEVMEMLVRFCYELFNRGRRHWGIRCPWERMRWFFHVEKDSGEDFKLTDHYQSRYARRIVEEHPDLAGFFEFRRLRAE